LITKNDLLEAIAECQGARNPNANTAVKLAAFYTIMDHLDESAKESNSNRIDSNSFHGYSLADPGSTVRYDGTSEFAQAVDGKSQADIWPVIDELMDTIKAMNNRLYNAVMKKLDL